MGHLPPYKVFTLYVTIPAPKEGQFPPYIPEGLWALILFGLCLSPFLASMMVRYSTFTIVSTPEKTNLLPYLHQRLRARRGRLWTLKGVR